MSLAQRWLEAVEREKKDKLFFKKDLCIIPVKFIGNHRGLFYDIIKQIMFKKSIIKISIFRMPLIIK